MTVETDRPGSEEGDRPPAKRRMLFGALVAVSVAGVIVWGSSRPAGEQVSVPSSSLSPVVAPTTTIPAATTSTESSLSNIVDRTPLAEFVPGINGQLVTLQGQGTFVLITRATDSPEAVISVPPGGWAGHVSLDASGDLIGLTTSTAGPDHLVLGDESELTDLKFLVTSYVWHETRPGEVATVIVNNANQSWNLNTFRFDQTARGLPDLTQITGFDSSRSVRAWNDSGFILSGHDEQNHTDFVEFIDPTGEIVWQQPGWPFDVSSTGNILIGDYTDEALTLRLIRFDFGHDGPGVTLEWAPSDFNAVRWSTNGNQIAFISHAGDIGGPDWQLDIYKTDGSKLHTVSIPWRVWDIQWSPDDRYVLMPGNDNQGTHAVVFYDKHTGTVSAVDDFQNWVQWSDLRD